MFNLKKATDIIVIIAFYLIGIGFILLFVYMHTSEDAREFLKGLNTTSGFRVTIFFGIVKLLSAILGVTITAAVTFKIIRDFKSRI
ncbi:MAG: hypothetical protein ABR597_02775 [Bacteroidales bacterium]